MKYTLAIFDMDGTLADTSPGIIRCHQYAHRMMGRSEPEETILREVIGGPLLETYCGRFGFSEEDARRAVAFYRQRYAEKGIYEAVLYPGMKGTLKALREQGLLLGIATLKAERFAKEIVGYLGISDCFDAIFGMDERDQRSKSELIRLCMETLSVSRRETVLIGDSIHDWKGTREAQVDFIGVTYGFGLQKGARPEGIILCHSPAELPQILLTADKAFHIPEK